MVTDINVFLFFVVPNEITAWDSSKHGFHMKKKTDNFILCEYSGLTRIYGGGYSH